jgi:hypothetical protein
MVAEVRQARPLDSLYVQQTMTEEISVEDGNGKTYFQTCASGLSPFRVSGALGMHSVWQKGKDGKRQRMHQFEVKAETHVGDKGHYADMFALFKSGMWEGDGDGYESVVWNGKRYRYFVSWMLDHGHTMRGLKYYLDYGHEYIDLMRATQRPDGMIYSFVQYEPNMDYFLTRDKKSGYSQRIGDKIFVRQPTENHPEYMYVTTIYQCWKSKGDDAWMRQALPSAERALEYALHDPARWSRRFQLLKRVYTIDSWDFAVEDEYMPEIGLTNSMIIDPGRSKFGIFFGDNTGYIQACTELSEMYGYLGDEVNAKKFKDRAAEFSDRLEKLSWNGRFYTHFIDEDSTVRRKLGVDEKSQFAQSNAYSLNRYIGAEKCKAIIESYKNLYANLPPGSPGEWYSIYPPFGRGFENHNAKWQYMNGGVGGHVAGELARGAYEQGYEAYATDVLNRLYELGKKHGRKIWFAYTGAMEPAPLPPVAKPVDLRPYVNMSHWSEASPGVLPWMGAGKKGDDLRNLPTGVQRFSGVTYSVIDPQQHSRGSIVAVSRRNGYPQAMEVPVNDSAGSIYLLHTSSKPSSEQIVGTVVFHYADGSSVVKYLSMEKHLTYWWFSKLSNAHAGIAWYGRNDVSEGVGLSWCAIDNPQPGRKIRALEFKAAETDVIYTLFAVSLSPVKHYVPVSPVSYGGPDNWAAATAVAAFVEGLAGVKDKTGTTAYAYPRISPRWASTGTDSVDVSICYPASQGYVRYLYRATPRRITIDACGSGEKVQWHILMPDGVRPKAVRLNGKPVSYFEETVQTAGYLNLESSGLEAKQIEIDL